MWRLRIEWLWSGVIIMVWFWDWCKGSEWGDVRGLSLWEIEDW